MDDSLTPHTEIVRLKKFESRENSSHAACNGPIRSVVTRETTELYPDRVSFLLPHSLHPLNHLFSHELNRPSVSPRPHLDIFFQHTLFTPPSIAAATGTLSFFRLRQAELGYVNFSLAVSLESIASDYKFFTYVPRIQWNFLEQSAIVTQSIATSHASHRKCPNDKISSIPFILVFSCCLLIRLEGARNHIYLLVNKVN